MNRIFLLVALLVGLVPISVKAQVAVFNDFGEEFPGPGGPGWMWWQGGGVGGGTDPFNPTFPHEISEDGLSDSSTGDTTTQAYKISFNTTDTTDWYWWGVNGGIGYFGPEYPAAGIAPEAGGSDPGNWVYSLDVRAVGALGDLALIGSFTFYDPDYEVTYGVDWNEDGDMEDGANTYQVSLNFLDNDGDPNGFTSNAIRLDAGTATTEVPGDIPRFSNDGNWVLGFNGGGGEYQFGDNSVTIDNLKIEYSEKPSVPGDYNDDGLVNIADYVVWRNNLGAMISLPNEGEGITPGEVTVDDYDFWKSSFGTSAGVTLASVSVPEPAGLVIGILASVVLASLCRPVKICPDELND